MFPTRIVEIILLLFCASVIGVAGSITCGTKTCADFEYCSPFDNTCQSCENVCDVQHHNYDANRCDKDCQNYLKFQSTQSLQDEIKYLRKISTISLGLSVILLLIFVIVAIIKFLSLRKKHHVTLSWIRKKLKRKEKRINVDRPTATNQSTKPDLRLDMPSVGPQTPSVNGNGETPSTTITTISRRPTEDNTLDYAYDNPVMIQSHNFL